VFEDYTVFDEDNEVKRKEIDKISDSIKQILKPCIMSLREAFECEDSGNNGYLSIEAFKKVLKEMEVKLKKVHVEYMVYEMYKVSKNSKKLKYSRIFELFDKDHRASQILNSDKKVDENYEEDSFLGLAMDEPISGGIDEEVKETAQDVGVQETEAEFGETGQEIIKEKEKQYQITTNDDHHPETYGEETSNHEDTFLDTSQNQDTQNNLETHLDTENNKFMTDRSSADQNMQNEGENNEDYLTDEEMIKLSENCLIRISNELIAKDVSIQDLFKDNIVIKEFEDQEIELLDPLHFIEGLKKLGIDDFNELEIACLVNLLTRPELEDYILVEELNILKDNNNIRESVTEMIGKSGQSTFRDNQDETDQPQNNEPERKRGMNFSKVGSRSI